MYLGKPIAVFAAAALLTAGVAVQAQKFSFDVVSIKPSAPGNGQRGSSGPRGDRLVMSRTTLKSLLQTAYPAAPGTNRQLDIIGGPPWLDTDMFDIEAKADCSNGPIDRARYALMIQSMLEDRFHLKAHTEPRETPSYDLVVAKEGLKFKLSADQTPLNPAGNNAPVLCPPPTTAPPASVTPPPVPGQRVAPFDLAKMRGIISFQYAPGSVTVTGNAVQINMLLMVAANDSGRPVIDKTNLKELYDFKFQFGPDRWSVPPQRGEPGTVPAATDPVPPLASAIQQLGLRLESVKVPIEVLVVESAQKPIEN
jgi:uncharacterized protein (TIGR03435 family)